MAEEKRIQMTQAGLEEIQEKLDYLIGTRRNEIAHQIEVARGFGDLSENAEYDEAKKEQAKLEEEINRLTHIRDLDEVVAGSTTRVGVGVTVTLEVLAVDEALKEDYNDGLEPDDPDYVEVGRTFTYAIVGSEEARPEENRISLDSELGRLLDGKRKKDEIAMEIPEGEIRYRLTKIEATKRRS